MASSIVTTGSLTDARTIQLDEAVPLVKGRVRVTVERLDTSTARPTLREFLNELRRQQAEQGHVPMTAAEIQSYIRAERASWGD